jgi:uncharacterized protein YegL
MSLNLSASFLGEKDKPILAVRIFPNALDKNPRPVKHLALLLDTSGSMSGERIQAVKRTIHLLVDALPEGDKLTLIQYNSEATAPVENAVIGADRSSLHTAVDGLEADGGTNLEAALFKLREILATSVDSVFLLTDGHINEGITSSSGLLRILGANAPPLNTLGFGEDYNSHTLKALSVNTRGSHTYADAAELIPAIIGDIVGGLASEVGFKAKLSIPAGWRCLELGYEDGDTDYLVGTLIAEKDQWVVLEGPAGSTEIPSISLSWNSGQADHTRDIQIDEANSKEVVSEQYNRTKVMSAFGKITDMLEENEVDKAKTALNLLLAELADSPSKDRPFVIRLMAQIDEMFEALNVPQMRMFRQNAVSSGIVPRMVSNQVALGLQRGIVSRLHSIQPPNSAPSFGLSAPSGPSGHPPPSRAMAGVLDSFSSPAQRQTSGGMVDRYSQQVEDESPPLPIRYMTNLVQRH